MTTASVRQQSAYLRQVLGQDKKPLSVFVGAGCPGSIKVTAGGAPLIPDIAGLTKLVRDQLLKDTTVATSMATVVKHFEDDGRSDFNIETLLTHLRTLRQVVGTATVRGLKSDDLEMLETKTTHIIVTAADKQLPGPGTSYHWLAAWVGAAARTSPVELFTTNYDLLLEQALEVTRVPFFDGFVGVSHPFFDVYAIEQDALPPRWARLWKLHGSINWHDEGGAVSRSGTLAEPLSQVIHPSHLKYDESRRMPYVVMADRLRAFLQRVSPSMVTCGYSYRDQHINAVLLDGLRANPTATVFGLLHGDLTSYPIAAVPAQLPPNISLFARDGACIGARRQDWDSDEEHSLFVLGDFSEFGRFLRDLSGPSGEVAPPESDTGATEA